MAMNKANLLEELKSLPDTNYYFYPERARPFTDGYSFDYPYTEDFRVGIIIDPCKYGKYDCCVNTFGTPEYGALKRNGLEEARVMKWFVLANDTDIQINSNLVYEDGTAGNAIIMISSVFFFSVSSFHICSLFLVHAVPAISSRAPDDEWYIDLECTSVGVPYSRCLGKNYAARRSSLRQACVDNNQTVDSMRGCYTAEGEYQKNCLAVAYTSNAFIPQCSERGTPNHCGTYLEIHQSQGSPYQAETDIIAEKKIETLKVSGYYTTTIPLTYMKNENRTLCSYTESFIRVGTIVYIIDFLNADVPVCCCPKPFKPATRVGSFLCPIGATGNGPFASFYKTLQDVLVVDPIMLEYPFCPSGLEEGDRMWCSVYDRYNLRHYTRECSPVYQRVLPDNEQAISNGEGSTLGFDKSWTSQDLDGTEYDGKCPYFESCTTTLDAGKCKGGDRQFTFGGYVGRVVKYDMTQNPPIVHVTFNDGRTSYQFEEPMVRLERKSMYEIWWVLRTENEFIVQKRKGFNVTNPGCSYDTTNDKYFPYARLYMGEPQD